MRRSVRIPWRRVQRCLDGHDGASGIIVYAAYRQVAYNGPQAAFGWDSVFVSVAGTTEMVTAEDPFRPWGNHRGPRWMAVPPGKARIEAFRPRILAPRSVDYAVDAVFRPGDVGLLAVKPVEPFPHRRAWQPIWDFRWLVRAGIAQAMDGRDG